MAIDKIEVTTPSKENYLIRDFVEDNQKKILYINPNNLQVGHTLIIHSSSIEYKGNNLKIGKRRKRR